MGKFVIKTTPSGGNRFNLLATNGQVIATSQVYKSLTTCKGGIGSVQACAPVASLEDQTQEDWEKTKCPKFQVYKDKAGEFRFRLLARNGQNICHGEGYTQLRSCLNGIESVRKNVVDAAVEIDEA